MLSHVPVGPLSCALLESYLDQNKYVTKPTYDISRANIYMDILRYLNFHRLVKYLEVVAFKYAIMS